MLKKLLNKLFGYRWSLYIARNENELIYAMHSDSVLNILGYVIDPFLGGKKPKAPWSLHLNFNKNHTSFKLESSHFTKSGNNLTPELISKIKSIDPKFHKYSGSKTVFMDMRKNEEIPISGVDMRNPTSVNLQERLDKMKKGDYNSDPTYFSIIRDIFK